MFLGKGIDVFPNKYCLVGEWTLGGTLTLIHAVDVDGHGADETRQVLPSLSSARVEQSDDLLSAFFDLKLSHRAANQRKPDMSHQNHCRP